MLYYPSHEIYFETDKLPARTEAVQFASSNGKQLSGLYLAPKDVALTDLQNKPIVIQFHGNAQNLTSHFGSLFWLIGHGYDYFIFDYEGYGASEGTPSPHKTVEDGLAALDWVHQRFPNRSIVLVGQSIGGAVAMRVAIKAEHKYPIKLVVIESSFDSYEAIGADFLSRSWITWLFQPFAYLFLSDSEAPGSDIAKIAPTPMIIIHGQNDPIVPYRFGQRVFERANAPKEFWTYKAPGHVVGFGVEKGKLAEQLLKKL